MAPPIGNQFWKQRSSHGRNPIFATPQDLWDAAEQYFDWVEENPLKEDSVGWFQGEAKHDSIDKMHAMTQDGMQIYLDISHTTWQNYCKKKDFVAITTRIASVIRTQKFIGASAGLLQPNIIARDLGLADKKELTGKDGGPIEQATVVVLPPKNA